MSLKIYFVFIALYSLFYLVLEIQEIIEHISVCLCIIPAFTLSVHLYSLPLEAQACHGAVEETAVRTSPPF